MNPDEDKWEYKTVWDQFQLSDSTLNQMGSEGWELVAFNKASSQVWSSGWTFKRRVRPIGESQIRTAAAPAFYSNKASNEGNG